MKRFCVIFAALLIVSPLTALAIEGQPDTEPMVGSRVPVAASQDLANQVKGESEVLMEELHKARIAGDRDLALALDAQIPRPKNTAGGEAGGTAQRLSSSFSGLGDPKTNVQPSISPDWWFDTQISPLVAGEVEKYTDVAIASNGDMYAVWQDEYLGDDYIQVYDSTDGGTTWNGFGFVLHSGADLQEPSIAIGEGSPGDYVLLAYIVDNGVDSRFVEVAHTTLTSGTFSIHAVTGPVATDWDFYKPVIWTDSHEYGLWYSYMTAEAIVGGVSTNRNVTTWRSTDSVTWDTPNFVWGNFDAETWMDPDGTFGTDGHDPFIVCFNDTTDTIVTKSSTDLGVTYGADVVAYTFPADQIPANRVDPDIEAAKDGDTVIVAATKAFSGNDNPSYTTSNDSGATWSYLNSMYNYTTDNEFGVALGGIEGGQSFHMTWTNTLGEIYYNQRLQTFGSNWNTTSNARVNDTTHGSGVYEEKGIAADWTSDRASIVWSDYREGGGVYKAYHDDDFWIIIILPIFTDGFESGNTSNWSSTVP